MLRKRIPRSSRRVEGRLGSVEKKSSRGPYLKRQGRKRRRKEGGRGGVSFVWKREFVETKEYLDAR